MPHLVSACAPPRRLRRRIVGSAPSAISAAPIGRKRQQSALMRRQLGIKRRILSAANRLALDFSGSRSLVSLSLVLLLSVFSRNLIAHAGSPREEIACSISPAIERLFLKIKRSRNGVFIPFGGGRHEYEQPPRDYGGKWATSAFLFRRSASCVYTERRLSCRRSLEASERSEFAQKYE